MRFRVKAGKHVEDGSTYKKGEVVDSHRDLSSLFPEKFELVHGLAEPEDVPEVEEEQEPAPTPLKKPASKAKKKLVEAFEDD